MDVYRDQWGDLIERFIAHYEQGPQNPESGAPRSVAIGKLLR
jgi:hypothetical protein